MDEHVFEAQTRGRASYNNRLDRESEEEMQRDTERLHGKLLHEATEEKATLLLEINCVWLMCYIIL